MTNKHVPRCGCSVNMPEADPGKYACPCGDHCAECMSLALVASYRRAEEAFNKAEKALETYFLPRIKDALNKNDLLGAYTIMHAIPDSVARVFAQDMIRQKETKGMDWCMCCLAYHANTADCIGSKGKGTKE